ncbi:MAG TPA: hypothetical protein VKY74_28505, partial [Chloroflexia bacterium]|nr:hypothetical protein [Chloroflexia bacterium]
MAHADPPLSDTPVRPEPGRPPAAAPAATGLEILTAIACTINSVLDLDQLYWVIYEQCTRLFATEDFW